MDPNTIKQQIVEKIKSSNNLLITVSSSPSVDQLSACIGLTLLLNKMDKHATAVFSGPVPSTIEFLKPENTLEKTTDSLRDFIISLDKAKADKLYFKVEGDLVKIYITPYHASLTQSDLSYAQGEHNVDAVIALGVKKKEELDTAITAHGNILHDATVISMNSGAGNPPDLGQLNWQDPAASGLCEMVVSVAEAFGAGLMDNQMATAFLTGIVAETARFSNPKTTPRVMTLSAQLMAAGANQQLIAKELNGSLGATPQATPATANSNAPQQVMAIEHEAPAAIPMPAPAVQSVPEMKPIPQSVPAAAAEATPAPIPMPEATPQTEKSADQLPDVSEPILGIPASQAPASDIKIDENGNVLQPSAPVADTSLPEQAPAQPTAVPMPIQLPPSEAPRALLPMDATPEDGAAFNSNMSDSDINESYDPLAPKKGVLFTGQSDQTNSGVDSARSAVEQAAQNSPEPPKVEEKAAEIWGMPSAAPTSQTVETPSPTENPAPEPAPQDAVDADKPAPPPVPPPLTV